MNTILQRTIQDTPENELLLRGLQEYVLSQTLFLNVSGEVLTSINNLVDTVEKLTL